MPRFCVLCGKPQSKSFSVFSFPVSLNQRAEWIKVIQEAKPDFVKDQILEKGRRLKNGVCELHFLKSEISKGKKCRLQREAIPSIKIISSTKRYDSVIKSNKSILTKYSIDKELEKDMYPNQYNATDGNHMMSDVRISDLDTGIIPECTLKIEIEDQEIKSPKVKIEFVENNDLQNKFDMCVLCGHQNSMNNFHSILKPSFSYSDKSLLCELSNLIEIPKEIITSYSMFMCPRCFRNLNDIIECKKSLNLRISAIKVAFNETRKKLKDFVTCSGNSYFKNSDNKNLEMNENNVRKSLRLLSNEKKIFACCECSEEFWSIASLSNHLKIHDDMETLTQNTTGKIISPNKAVGTKNKHPCSECKETFFTQHGLLTHAKSHQQCFDCPCCGRLITSKARLNYHMHKFHGVGEGKVHSFMCKSCERSFTSKAGLRYHECTFHKIGETYTCELCNKVFYYLMLYKSHKLYAHGKKTIVCEICGEMFFTVSKLNVHINSIHRNALTWICKLCNKKFTTTTAYRHHVSMKHKLIKHKCNYCNVQFRKKNSLNHHLWKHNIYMCQRCNNRYDDPFSFALHLSDAHKIDISKKLNFKHNLRPSIDENSLTPVDESHVSENSKDRVSSVVINDILITSDAFDNNSNLRPFTFQNNDKNKDQESFTGESSVKLKTFNIVDSSQDLSTVEPLHFGNVDGLEIQSVNHDSIELEEDVSLISVQMLEDIDISHTSTLKELKSNIMPPDNIETLSISHDLHNKLSASDPSRVSTISNNVNLQQDTQQGSSESNSMNQIAIIGHLASPNPISNGLNPHPKESSLTLNPLVSSHLNSPEIGSTSQICNLPVIVEPTSQICNLPVIVEPCNLPVIVEPCNLPVIVEPCNLPVIVEPTQICNLPVIVEPVKPSSWDCFNNSLEEEPAANPPAAAVIHTLAVERCLPVDLDPPVTQEIDIEIPPDEEPKIISTETPVNAADKTLEEELPTLSVNLDGNPGQVHYKYLMYFNANLEKNGKS